LTTRFCFVVLSFCVLACSSPKEAEEERGSETRYEMPANPTDLLLETEQQASIAYGRCAGEDFECGTPWAEVAWYRLSAETVAAEWGRSGSELRMRIDVATAEDMITDPLDVTVFEVLDDGSQRHIGQEAPILDRSLVEIELQNNREHHVFITRYNVPHLGTRVAEFSLRAYLR
jgi:hypothetical protein